MAEKPKLGMYWAAACGGCEIALVNLNEKILALDAAFDLFFCPCLMDRKKKDIEDLPDRALALTLFNGAIRTEENEEMARLLRRKSELLIAFGSCAAEGCIPGLANFSSRDELLQTVYCDSFSTDNPRRVLPCPETVVPEGTLRIPAFYDEVRTLAQVVEVDFFIPGCPPEPHQIWNVVSALMEGAALPPRGSVIGAGSSAVCSECRRKRTDKKITKFFRTYEVIPDSETCLLEQGLLCMGIATRDGCGGLCPNVNMPCTGCYGPPEGVMDQGAKMVAALGSVIDIGETKGLDEVQLAEKVDAVIASIPDYAGMFYKYSLPGSILGGRR